MRIAGKSRAAGMLIFTTLAWGAMFAVAKSALGAIDAFWLSTLRYVPAPLARLLILWRVEGRRALSLAATAVGFAHLPMWQLVVSLPGQIAYLSIVGAVLAVLAWNAGIAILGPANGVLFINLVPITGAATRDAAQIRVIRKREQDS